MATEEVEIVRLDDGWWHVDQESFEIRRLTRPYISIEFDDYAEMIGYLYRKKAIVM